jgi:hypothetical protein
MADRLRGFRQGLAEAGYVLDRVPALAAELVRQRVAAIIGSGGIHAVIAAKAATATIPIIFIVSEDPVRLGLVKSLARPEGNLTGVLQFRVGGQAAGAIARACTASRRNGGLRQSGQHQYLRGHAARHRAGRPRYGAANQAHARQHATTYEFPR